MAKLIADMDPNEIPFDSERLVYLAFRELPSGYVVMHSFPWLRPRRDFANEPLAEGEADFVVLHPELGVLVVEVKGGLPSQSKYRKFSGQIRSRRRVRACGLVSHGAAYITCSPFSDRKGWLRHRRDL